MFRPASRSLLRSTQSSLAPARTTARRFLTTASPHQKSRSWKSSAARWGLAIASIYYYNTSELFAEQPAEYRLDPKADYDKPRISPFDTDSQSSGERKGTQQSIHASLASKHDGIPDNASSKAEPQSTSALSASSPGELEDEASSEGAFNPTTGEINWDCPCLGGMAHGPCGDAFRAAFSCFVFSEEEPKGMNCIDKFQGMQECFQAHPDVYAAELEGDDSEELHEGLEEERQELAKEIKGRKQTAGTASAEPIRGKRLLEDDPPMERRSLLRRSQPQPQSQPNTPPPTPPPSSSEPHSPASEEHKVDAQLKGKPLPTKGHPESSPSKATEPKVFDEDLELMPKEWHSSSSGSDSTKRTEK